MEKKKLRVALLLRSFQLASWKYYAVKEIINTDVAEIVLTAKLPSGPAYKNWQNTFFFRTYLRFEKMKWKGSAKASETKDIAALLTKNHKTDEIKLKKVNGHYHLTESDSQILTNANPDVVYLLDYFPIKFDLANISQYGVWYHHFGLAGSGRESSVGFWEFLKGSPFIFSSLRSYQPGHTQEVILYESKGPVNLFSISATRESCFWKSARFVERKLKELDRKQTVNPLKLSKSGSTANVYKVPRLIDLLKLNLTYLKRFIKEKLTNRVYSQKWGLQFQFGQEDYFSLNGLTTLLPPKNKFWADPFIYKKNNEYFVFLEESYLGKKKKGFISVAEISPEGIMSQTKKIIERPYHMSYPFIFQFEGKRYMIPETNQNFTIELYECRGFPYHWEFVKNLRENISAVDTTLFYHEEKWWIFTNIKENKHASLWDELFLFFTDNPLSSEWTPHPCNPIVSDVTKARPAGQIFKADGKIFRPTQNCSYRYGYGLSIQEITDLTTSSYQETEIATFAPEGLKGISGLHTFNKLDEFTVIDAVIKNKRKIW